MLHPALRNLVTLLLAIWSPLCCCQAAGLLGSRCSDLAGRATVGHHEQPAAHSCCSTKGCDTRVPGIPPTDDQNHEQDADCVVCKGKSAVTSVADPVKLSLAEPLPDALAAMLLTGRTCIGTALADAPATADLESVGRPVAICANRELLRRECALIV
jgi:hypothetical protein